MKDRIAAAALAAALAVPAAALEEASKPKDARPLVEVVFAIDTTGSMSGLIEGAKRKVWAIANEVAKGKPVPRIRMGLVAYRDRGDEYVTKVFDLTDNLDAMYKELLTLSAGGGGDGPEHVLKALADSIEKISWSKEKKALRIVYLVGDAPPHEDYKDTPGLEALLEKAVRKGLIVNAVQCGSDGQTLTAWQKVARLGEGKFLPIPHDGGVAAVATPFDEKLAAVSRRLEGTLVGYGRGRAAAKEAGALSAMIAGAAAPAAMADRAVFKAARGFSGEMDLASAVADKKVDLDSLRDEELPEAWRGLSSGARKAKLTSLSKEREGLREEIASLNEQRADFLKREAPKAGAKDSFDGKLVESLKAQAAAKGIAY